MISDLTKSSPPSVVGSGSLSPPPTPSGDLPPISTIISHKSQTDSPAKKSHTSVQSSSVTENLGGDASPTKFNFNIPHFIKADTSLVTQENSSCSSSPSSTSSIEESKSSSFINLPDASSLLLSPASVCSQDQQSLEYYPHFHYEDSFHTDNHQSYMEETQEDLLSYMKNNANEIFLNDSTVNNNQNNYFYFNSYDRTNRISISNDNTLTQCIVKQEIPESNHDVTNCSANNSTLNDFLHHRNPVDQILDLNSPDLTSDINNNIRGYSNKMASFLNNNHAHPHHLKITMYNNENDRDVFPSLSDSDMSSLTIAGSLPNDNFSSNGNDISLLDLDTITFNTPSSMDFTAIDSCPESDVSSLRSLTTEDELEFINPAGLNTRSLLYDSITISDFHPYLDTSCSTSGDDLSEVEYKVRPLEQDSSAFNPLYHNSYPGSNEHPQSPTSTSDEGFESEDGPPTLEENLPFQGNFIDTEVPSTFESDKKSRKRLYPFKPKKKTTPPSPTGERRKPGRKPGQVSNVLHLWEFMRDLLHHPKTNGEIIEWISQTEGVFRVVNSAEVARLWGEKKNNKKAMTYEKLSRSLRYSRLEGYFDNLPKDKNYPKKLCFKFGPKSNNWSS